MSFYPAFLDLRGRRAVVVGGGAVAEQKVAGLVEAGARVTVISPALTWKLEDLAAQGTIVLRRRGYRRGDLAGAFLAIAAADDRRVNRTVWREAEARGVLLNAVDDLPHCSFIAPAVHREGAITVAVSTAGKSPAFAVRLRERIARLVGPEHAAFVELLGELRATVADRVPDARARTRLWYAIVDSAALDDVRRGDLAGARRRIARLIEEAAAGAARPAASRPRGIVYLVGAGPGHPGLITVRGLELVRAADAVVYDRLVHPRLVEEAPAWAERIFVGKRPAGRSVAQERTNDLLVELARAGQAVVRLKGGDPFVFGRGAEECAALAAAGIPVTHRAHASAFAVAAGREAGAESDLDWEALARMPAVVFLMGLGALPAIAARLRAHGARGDTPAAVIARATLADQRVVVGTLDTIAARAREAGLAPPATVVVGDVVRVAAALGAPAAPAAPGAPARAIPAEHDAVAVVV